MRSQSLVVLTLVMFAAFSATIATSAELVAHWTLDDGAGATAADLAGGFDGTLQGNPVWEANGKVDGALVFDGVDDYIQTTLMDRVHTAENFTIAAWFKTNVTAEGQQHILWMGDLAGNGWGEQQELHIGINHFGFSNKVVGYFGSGTDTDGFSINIVSKEDFTDTSSWHHLALAIKNASGPIVTGKLFLDGKWVEPFVDGFETTEGVPFPTIDSTENPPDRTGWNTALRIGCPGAASRYFNGMIDDVTIWDQALEQDNIQGLMTGGPSTPVKPGGKLVTTWVEIRASLYPR
jgi:hypothetical protein